MQQANRPISDPEHELFCADRDNQQPLFRPQAQRPKIRQSSLRNATPFGRARRNVHSATHNKTTITPIATESEAKPPVSMGTFGSLLDNES